MVDVRIKEKKQVDVRMKKKSRVMSVQRKKQSHAAWSLGCDFIRCFSKDKSKKRKNNQPCFTVLLSVRFATIMALSTRLLF
jgi:hypothetical protein